MNEILQVSENIITGSLRPALVMTAVWIIVNALLPLPEMKMMDSLWNLVKSIVYGILATYIYLNVSQSSSTTVDVLTTFTFLLAALEAIHNFANSIGMFFSMVLKTIFKKIFHPSIV